MIAIFDLDGTITHGDTFCAFLLFVLLRRLRRLPRCIPLVGVLLGFLTGRLSNDFVKQQFLNAVAGGCTRASLDPMVRRFVRWSCARMVKPAALERIAWHRNQGHRLILATASLDLYADAIGRALGFVEIVSTPVAWQAGRVTGELAGPNLRGEQKLAAIQALAGFQDQAPPYVFAYSDHHSDLPLLRFADSAVAVDPTPRLRAQAFSGGLQIECWKR